MFKVIGTDTYLKEISKWSNVEIGAAEKIPEQLKENPFVWPTIEVSFLERKAHQGKESLLSHL